MAIIKPNNNTISAITALPAGVGGKVLQVVSNVYTGNTITTSTSFGDSGLSASITPSSSSNKVLILTNQLFGLDDDTDDRAGGSVKLVRGSTDVYAGDLTYEIFIENNTTNAMQYYFRNDLNFLDTPSSTSSVTYKTQMRIFAGNNRLISNAGAKSSITLMEIAG